MKACSAHDSTVRRAGPWLSAAPGGDRGTFSAGRRSCLRETMPVAVHSDLVPRAPGPAVGGFDLTSASPAVLAATPVVAPVEPDSAGSLRGSRGAQVVEVRRNLANTNGNCFPEGLLNDML